MNGGWFEEVAAKAKVGIPEAETILRRRGIRPRATVARAKAMRLTSLAFSGRKDGHSTDSFDFVWDGLGDGVWAVASDGSNLVGKSTVLEIMLWCLRGDVKRLQDDVRKWLERVRLEFVLDGQVHAVEFAVSGSIPNGSLQRIRPSGEADEIDRFSSEEGFAITMSRFMMASLDLEPIPSQNGKDETATVVEHSWPSLSAGLYFGGDHEHLLGDTQYAGLPGRILQLYVGLPWASTVMQASTALKQLKVEGKIERALATEAAGRNAEARARTENDLKTAKAALAGFGDETEFIGGIEALAEEVVRSTRTLLDLERKLAEGEDEANALRAVADADEREVRSIRESFVATSFFNGLQPTCCPRCETGVSKDRIRRETVDFSCSVCTEAIDPRRMEGVNERLDEAEDRMAATRAASVRANALTGEIREAVDSAKKSADAASKALGEVPTSGRLVERREAELKVARLEGALAALPGDVAPAPANSDRNVVKAAYAMAKGSMDSAGETMFKALDEEVLALAQRFGMVALESVAIDAQGHMSLRKGGADTKFSAVTKGERLRLRLATAIGLLKVGQRLGVGRHPGLLIVDSPGADETEPTNLETLLKELRAVAEGEVGLQVFVSSAKATQVLEVLAPEKCRVAAEGQYLW